jgi:DivIVA domain-containing protein
MAISFSRPDPSSPTSVASAAFTTSRKGFEQAEVREFLRMVAAELARLQERERFLERELRQSQRSANPASVALDEEMVTKMLGEEAARILQAARDASGQIRARAEESAARLLKEATDESQRMREEIELEMARRRQDATADAEAEIEMAKQQGRDMVNEARAYRERVLGELSRRREMARQQIEQLVHGRDRLLNAFERARIAAVDVMADLTPLGEPSEFVNLSPTTGPVPLMVPNMPRPGTVAPAAPAPAVEADPTVALVAPVAPSAPLADDPDVTAALAIDTPVADAPDADDTVVLEVVETIVEIEIDDEPVAADEPTADAEPHPAVHSHANVVSLFGDGRRHPADYDDEPVADEIEPATEVDAEVDVEDEFEPDVDLIDDVTDEVIDDAHPSDDDTVALSRIHLDETRHLELDARTVADIDSLDSLESEHLDEPTPAAPRRSADDLFARLRAARAESVAERAAQPAAPTAPAPVVEPPRAELPADAPVVEVPAVEVPAPRSSGDSVFRSSTPAPAAAPATDDTPFARRDEVLTPLIVATARKLKRVLADEQNDVLHSLRSKEPVRSVDVMVSAADEQVQRYAVAVRSDLTAAAVAGAMSMGVSFADAGGMVERADAVAPALALLASEVIEPLRARLERCVADADGDNTETASLVRLAYREWKSQRIDEQLDDIARTAFGHGALAGLPAGTPICWKVDPNGPDCADAEDNSLGGVVPAGMPFPTDHRCAPAHNGCRCMIVRAD